MIPAGRVVGQPVERLPFEPLAHYRDEHLAELVGVGRRTVVRWRRRGIPADWADEIAIRLGYHPVELWPAEW